MKTGEQDWLEREEKWVEQTNSGEDQRVKIDWESFSAGEPEREREGGMGGGEKTTCENRTSFKRRKGVRGLRWGRQRGSI